MLEATALAEGVRLQQVSYLEVKKMQCKEFRELSEAYLSDQLLVETNLTVYRHLEACSNCRADFAARRALRGRIRRAVMEQPEMAISPDFEMRLRSQLRDEAIREPRWKGLFRNPRLLIPIMTALLITFFGGYAILRNFDTEDALIVVSSGRSLASFLTEISIKAVGQHKDCALGYLDKWESGSFPISGPHARDAELVALPLRANISNDFQILHSHDCLVDGRKFLHVIIKQGERVVSVFIEQTKDGEDIVEQAAKEDSIICEKENGLQVASFRVKGSAVFVVSDLPEPENLRMARVLSDSFSV
jgi:hypothetical protein